MRVVGIIQARYGSSRLPGKILADVRGRPLLSRVIQRALAAAAISSLVVATTLKPEDDVTADLAQAEGISVYRGSTSDVLDRYYKAASAHHAEVVVRLTADDPLKDPALIDSIVQAISTDPRLDYVSNTIRPTYPEGLDVEAIRFAALSTAWNEAKRPTEREHVTPYIWKDPQRFRLKNIESPRDLSTLRWTVDYAADLEFVRTVYRFLGDGVFGMNDIVRLLCQHPELRTMPAAAERNAGYRQQLRAEEGGND